MKTTRVFKMKIETPCPACAGPRVGVDRDDVYEIMPGLDPKLVKCHCPGCIARQGTYTKEEAMLGKACDACGHQLKNRYNVDHEDRMRRRYYDAAEYELTCAGAKTPYWDYTRMPGCPKCREVFSI